MMSLAAINHVKSCKTSSINKIETAHEEKVLITYATSKDSLQSLCSSQKCSRDLEKVSGKRMSVAQIGNCACAFVEWQTGETPGPNFSCAGSNVPSQEETDSFSQQSLR